MTHERAEPITVLPPLSAYRRDVERLGVQQLSADDGAWIAAAVALAHLARLDERGRRAYHDQLESLLEVAAGGVGVLLLDAAARSSPPLVRLARVLAERSEEASAWHLALAILSLTERALNPDLLDVGRLRAQRARIHWKSGCVNEAEAAYRELVRAGRKQNEPELISRGYIGLASVSQVRGNYPAVSRWATRAARVAQQEALTGIDALAQQLLMVSAGQRGDHARALAHGWAALTTVYGDPVREAEMLLNLAQLLVTIGEHHAALAGFVAALERGPPARLALPAWGGVATSASRLRERRITLHAAAQIERVAMTPGLQYARASALAEAALALEHLQLESNPWRRTAMALAVELGFNEISYRLEAPMAIDARRTEHLTPVEPARRRLPPASAAVITAVDALVDVESSRVLV